DNLAPRLRRAIEHFREAVGREIGATGTAEVEIPGAGGLSVVGSSGPEGADSAVAVSPSAAEPASPARGGEDARARDLGRPVWGPLEKLAGLRRTRDETETGVWDRFVGEPAVLEVDPRISGAFPDQFKAADVEECLQQICTPVARLRALERRR